MTLPPSQFAYIQMKLIAIIVCAAAFCGLVGLPAHAQPSSDGETEIEWYSGKRLRDSLAQPGNCLWQDTPLRMALESFSSARHVAVILDRRVDPGQLVNLTLTDLSGEEILEQVSQSREVGFCFLGPVAYFGPFSTTRRLRTVAELRREEIRGLQSGVAGKPPKSKRSDRSTLSGITKKLLESERFGWSDLATPRDLLSELAAENQFEILGIERIPHDLWAACNLPPLPLSDRLTLILAQFDLTFNVTADGSSIGLVAMPETPVLVRDYPGGRHPESLVSEWFQRSPDCRFKVVNGRVYVQGRLEDHELITEPPRPTAAKPRETGPLDLDKMRFKTKVPSQPFDKVLGQIAAQLQLELRLDRKAFESAGVSPEQRISFSVTDATFDQLMDAIVGPAGCTWHREGNLLEVHPAKQ